MKRRIEYVQGDITQESVDVIVNAAHEILTGGGGVDGAIHRAAGPMLAGECMNLPTNEQGERCPVGQCRMTGGYDLPALYVLHTVGPVWRGGGHSERCDLLSCYRNCMLVAQMQGLQSIAFPNISTGAFGMPKDIAAETALLGVKGFLEYHETMAKNEMYCDIHDEPCTISLVKFVCFDEENLEQYKKLMPEGFVEYDF